MYSGTLLIFFWTLVLVKSYPALVYDYYSFNPNTGNFDAVEVRDDNYQNPAQKSSEKISSSCLRDQNGDVKCFINNDGNKGIILEKLESSLPVESTQTYEIVRQLEPERTSVYDQNFRNLDNAVVLEVVPGDNPNYNVYQHDGAPKRYSTYIHGLVPSQEIVLNSNLNPFENRLPFNRPPRKTQSYEEFLAQLSHDAMMNNILPTMPYLRTPGQLVAYDGTVPIQSVQAAYPHAGSVGCAQPVLFGCSPVISQGYIAQQGYPYALAPEIKIAPYKGYAVPTRKVILKNKVKPLEASVGTTKHENRMSVDSGLVNDE